MTIYPSALENDKADISAYREFCFRNNVPLFAQDYWLDAVCGDKWNVFPVYRSGKMIAAMPYFTLKRLGMPFMIQPQLTQFLGLQVDYTETGGSEYNRRSLFRKCSESVMEQMRRKRFVYVQCPMQYGEQDWLSYYWKGFRATPRYTYVIEDISNPDEVIRHFHPSKRRHLKSVEAEGLTVDLSLTADDFYNFHAGCLLQRGQKVIYSRAIFRNICHVMCGRKSCVIVAVRGRDGALQSAVFVVWDRNSAYQLMSCTDMRYGSGGASTYAVEQAIRYCSSRTHKYDFEGSMIHDVEYSYSKFGTTQKLYIYLEKFNGMFTEMALRILGRSH